MCYLKLVLFRCYLEFNIEIKKGVPKRMEKIGVSFCLQVLSIKIKPYRCRSPPLLHFDNKSKF